MARAFSSTGQNKGKPDVFSLIQKGLQSLPSKTQSEAASSEDPRREKQKNYDSGESGRDHQQPQNDRSEETTTSSNKDNNVGLSAANLVTSMLRMVGFDATKLGALAINVLIMVASTVVTI